MSRNGCVALPRCAIGLSAVCNCGISSSYSLTIFGLKSAVLSWGQTSMTQKHYQVKMLYIKQYIKCH